jgi:hypothetical protein
MDNYPSINDIKIYDNFFSENIQNKIIDFLSKPKWSFTGGNEYSQFWHIDNLEKERYFNTFLFRQICKKLEKKFKIERIYANGQTAGQSGVPHVDDGKWTFLYYPNKEWYTIMNGSLFFLEKPKEEENTYYNLKSEIVKTVSYKSNRAVFFPSKILHYADAPERHYTGVRISLAYKLL